MLLKYRSKPKFRFNKIYLRPLKNGRISKADDYFWKINRKLKAHYRPILDGRVSPNRPVSQSRFCKLEVYKAVIGDLTQSANSRHPSD